MLNASLFLVAAIANQDVSASLKALPPYTKSADVGDYTIAPPYANAPELTPRVGVPKGTVYRFTMDSKDSKIYPGIAKDQPLKFVPYTRRVSVYVPANYQPGTPEPFLVAQDSMGANILPTILDNMIADKRIPQMAAIFIDSGGSDSLGSERGLEYDTLSGRYAEFIETEVLPRASKESGVTFTKDPNARIAMGGSSGAACAFTMAWYHPDLYRRVISYSGTYVNQQWPYDPATPHGAWEYHEHLIPNTKKKPIRIWMHVSENDLRQNDPESTYHNWPMANQRMAAVLKAKGYPYQFVYSQASGHVDGRVTGQTLPQALEWVWKGYRK
jgi:enterochelin esterase-like enzyme